MAKAAIFDVLENTIGKYVQNLDAESLNVAVWAGKIELNSLQLDVEAVNRNLARKAAEAPNLAIPFRVVSGSFSHLRVDVPWARITSRPVVMRLSGLNAIVEPFDHLASKFDHSHSSTGKQVASTEEEKHKAKGANSPKKKKKVKKNEREAALSYAEEGRQRANTMRKLAELEAEDDVQQMVADVDTNKGSDQNRSAQTGFKAKLVRRIIENLQVDIDGVNFEMRGQGSVAGIVLDHFSIVTTDKDGTRTFVDRATNSNDVENSFIYKVLSLKGLGIYCDQAADYLRHKPPSQYYEPLETRRSEERNYILSPLSFEAKLRQSDCITCVDFPKYLLSTKLPSVSIKLSRIQLELINNVKLDIAKKQHVSRPLFPEYRPDQPISSGNAKEWWKYAVRAVGRITRKRSWTEYYLAFQKRKRYISLHKRVHNAQDCSWLTPLNDTEEKELLQIEKDKSIGVQGIMNWRTISEGQIELERKKFAAVEANRNAIKASQKKKFFLFKTAKDDKSSSLDEDDDIPIALSASEVKELENIAREEFSTENELSNDSILCDVEFHLGSFEIDLITFSSQPLASFQMGALSSSFKANVDGSFVADFQMSSFHIGDLITKNTLFPYVVRSLEQPSESDAPDALKHTFGFKLVKSKNGDQSLEARLVSFEIVACDNLVQECKRFITFSQEDYHDFMSSQQQPLMDFSVSGGTDLFYDANDPLAQSTNILAQSASILTRDDNDLIEPRSQNNQNMSSKITSAFSDAWKSKLEKKISWSVLLDIRAPILVLPNSCVDPMATVLVADLGTFRFAYGGGDLKREVQDWFKSNSAQNDRVVDNCCLEMHDFTFLIGIAGNKDWLIPTHAENRNSEAIIEPISFSINIGIENGGAQRKCVMGILPSVSLKITYAHIIRITSVISTWRNLFDSVVEPNEDILNGVELGIPSGGAEGIKYQSEKDEIDVQSDTEDKNEMYLSFALQRLSLQITNANDESIEAHLISAVTSFTQVADGPSAIRVQMGHFWIIDHLRSTYPRRQRLIAHSCLPKPALTYAERDCYDILKDFENLDSAETPSLADVTVLNSTKVLDSFGDKSVIIDHARNCPVTKIDAKFSTLFINWNPYTIRQFLDFIDDVTGFFSKLQTEANTGAVVIANNSNDEVTTPQSKNNSLLILNAEMEAFEICLNSAIDDMPLFMMKMCDAKVQFHASQDLDENQIARVVLGDLRLEVPSKKKILGEYTTVLGLSSDFSSSLLCMEFGKGPISVQSCTLESFDKKKTEMYIDVTLSPMRFVYIQSQILTLVEYTQEGVLGALTKKVASSAAQAAYDIAQTQSIGENVFFVKATGFHIVLPQAAYSSENLSLHVNNMSVCFTTFPTPGEAYAGVKLDDVTMQCNREESIIANPICLNVEVSLAPSSAPTLDDQATRIMISISTADLLFTRNHYTQIMQTLTLNIGEENSFLRDEEDVTEILAEQTLSTSERSTRLTHGGAEELIVRKRMYMKFKFEKFGVELCDETENDPIVAINAVKTTVSVRLFPHEDKMEVDATLHDLIAEDRRLIAINRHFRKLVSQLIDSSTHSDPDVFKLKYIQTKKQNVVDQSVKIDLGRPQIVFIPDLISESVAFFRKDDDPPQSVHVDVASASSASSERAPILDECYSLQTFDSINEMKQTKKLELELNTKDCRFVLIDMGMNVVTSSKYTEAIVLKGETEVKAEIISDAFTGEAMKTFYEAHGEKFEVYTAEGEGLMSPVQVLDPFRFSAFYNTSLKNRNLHTDISFVTLAPVKMTVSMQNYAHLMAILSSTGEAWVDQNNKEDDISKDSEKKSEEKVLSKEVVEQIEKVSTVLAVADDSASTDTGIEMVFRDNGSTAPISSNATTTAIEKRIISMKLTLPETTLTVVNDLQGLDDALFKVIIQSCVWGADASTDELKKNSTVFHVHANSNILADYFDSNSKLWEPLLLKPWEIDLKCSRGLSRLKKSSSRFITTVDIESHPCQLSFSEQLIISLRGASSMWSLYSDTTSKALDILNQVNKENNNISFLKARASHTARAMTTTMPYGIENRTGFDLSFTVSEEMQLATTDTTTFFAFPFAHGDGVGGSRLYGQDVTIRKPVDVFIDNERIHFSHIDDELNSPKRAHRLEKQYIFSEVKKLGKSTIIIMSSFLSLYNQTALKFNIALRLGDRFDNIGSISKSSALHRRCPTLGVPTAILQEAYASKRSEKNIGIQLSHGDSENLAGDFELPPFQAYYKIAKSTSKSFEVVCSKKSSQKLMENEVLTLKIHCRVSIIDDLPDVQLYIQPRLVLQNLMSIKVFARTPMPFVFKNGNIGHNDHKKGFIQELEPFETLEVYSSSKSVQLCFKCADIPIGDIKIGWNQPGWIELPLSSSAELPQRIDCHFPFISNNSVTGFSGGGTPFYVSELSDHPPAQGPSTLDAPKIRKATLNIENLGVDHTGDFLFESCSPKSPALSLSSFSSSMYKRRITLLPKSRKFIRLLQLSTATRSMPFNIDQIAFANGGTDSTSLKWSDETESGFYAYKKISFFNNVENHAQNQLEVHIIPAIIIYNGGDHSVRIVYAQGQNFVLHKGKMAPVGQSWGEKGLRLSIDFLDSSCSSDPLMISKTGLLVSVVRSTKTGFPIGSVAIQTMIGRQDSRYVIKIGPMKHGDVTKQELSSSSSSTLFANDLLRFRCRWSEMKVTFLDTSKSSKIYGKEIEYEISENSNRFVKKKNTSYSKVAHVALKRFTIDFQKVFKDDVDSTTMKKRSQARTQFAVIIHSLILTDCTEDEQGTIVLASISKVTNFFELCIRTRDTSYGIGVTNVDLLEVKLANNGKNADQIILNTSEAFLWSILDILSRTKNASMVYAALDTNIQWNDEAETFNVEAFEKPLTLTEEVDEHGNYTAPRSDALYAVKKACVLPTSFLVSFKRQPQTSRYQKVANVKSAKIVDYFTKKLNFTVDSAKLRFSGFQVHNVKGPPERILDLVKAFYSSQMKAKIFTLLTATSIDEWKQLAGRDGGEKGYLEGDLLRTAGNLTGKSAGFIVKKVGQGISLGVRAGTAEIGNGIQDMTEVIGVGAVGAGVNSVLSGIGGGVGSTVEGVGDGGSKIIKGAGKGVGQIVGGVGGGLLLTAKGIGKGVTQGDGKAVLTGIEDGALAIGTGVLKGGESVVTGVGDGVLTVGKGIFKGVQNIGKGIGGAVTGGGRIGGSQSSEQRIEESSSSSSGRRQRQRKPRSSMKKNNRR